MSDSIKGMIVVDPDPDWVIVSLDVGFMTKSAEGVPVFISHMVVNKENIKHSGNKVEFF